MKDFSSGLRRIGGVPLVIALCAFATQLSALSFVQMKDADLAAQADGAIVATVVGKPVPVFDARGVRRATRYSLDVEEVLGGAVSTHALVQLPGWQGEEGSAWRVPGVVSLQPNDRLVIVYERRADGILLPLQANLGVFIERESGGARFLDRQLDEAVNVSPGTNDAYNAARDSYLFKRWLRSTLAGDEPAVDYLVSAPAKPKFTSITGAGTRVRWFQFDNNITVNWRANSDGQVGMVQDEFAMFQASLNAWNNDVTSRIQWGTVTTIAPGAADPPTPFGRVIWNDPNDQIGGSFNCATGGTLALAGPSWFVTSTPYRGMPYHQIQNAQMITQDNAACFFDSAAGANGREVFAHEIGHTLGFGHSCGDGQSPACAPNPIFNQAIMRALAHGDGRGAGLGVDDIAAANTWYFLVTDFIFGNGFE